MLGFWGLAQAADDRRELNYSELVEQTLQMGEIVWLQTEGRPFLTIYSQTEQRNSLGTAILLHDQGGFADQKPLIHRLRTELPQHRWTTLSLQLPVLEDGAPDDDYLMLEAPALRRIDSAIAFLKKNNINNIVLVGHGLGASFALAYAEKKPAAVKALALISLKLPTAKKSQQDWIKKITALPMPVLDIYAGRDAAETVLTARKRRLAGRENAAYRQLVIADADRRYSHNETLLIKRIYSWLSRQFN